MIASTFALSAGEIRRFTALAALFAGLILVAAGCGDDGEDAGRERPGTTATAPVDNRPEPGREEQTEERTTTEPEAETAPPERDEGDEQPIRSQVNFVARRGRITPRTANVPPFILVYAHLRLPPGQSGSYRLTIGGRTLSVGPKRGTDVATLPPLRPGESYVGRPSGAGNTVRIEASNEPE